VKKSVRIFFRQIFCFDRGRRHASILAALFATSTQVTGDCATNCN
jgi:hypothetical protein